MNFELGKEYIVKVSEKGVVPIEEFDESRWYDKDHDDLDFLTDREKIVVINQVLDKIRAEVENINVWGMRYNPDTDKDRKPQIVQKVKEHVIEIIDKYKAETEET